MSRIGKKPVEILPVLPSKSTGNTVNAEGPKGKLTINVRPEITVSVKSKAGNELIKLHEKTNRVNQEPFMD